MNEIQEEISSFEPGVFEPTRRTLVRFEFEDCACDPASLPETVYVTSDFYPDVVAEVVIGGTGPTCEDVQYGGQDPDGFLIVGMDFLSPTDTKWKMGFDGYVGDGLYKIAGSGGSCDIESPVGHYEDGTYFADVTLDSP